MLFALGLLHPLGSLWIAASMVTAIITVHWSSGALERQWRFRATAGLHRRGYSRCIRRPGSVFRGRDPGPCGASVDHVCCCSGGTPGHSAGICEPQVGARARAQHGIDTRYFGAERCHS